MKTTTGTRSGVGGVTLHTIEWAPTKKPVADVVLVHGLGEHSGRYTHVGEAFTAAGLRVHALDLRGHGQSVGVERGEVDSFEDLVTDVEHFIDDVRSTLPVFLVGHSMGGLAAVRVAERKNVAIDGLVAQAAAIRSADSIPDILVKVVNVAARLAPTMRTIALDGSAISRDPQVVADYDADPLNFRGKITTRTGSEMNNAMRRAVSEFAEITVPILVLHGARDRLTDPAGSLDLASSVSSTDVRLVIVPGAFHELHNEPDRAANIALITDWISEHLKAS